MSLLVHLTNVLNLICPVRETFGLRCRLYRAGGIKVGRGTRITHGVAFYDRYITIGDAVWIGPNTRFCSTSKAHITIEDNVDIAPCCCIMSGTHEIGGEMRRAGAGAGRDVRIGAGTWVGGNSTVLPGAIIGPGCIVAAGSVVTAGEYPANSLLAGVPARVRRPLSKS
jgi:acetyltransferase-like isoleucine patch superfamily enzyme